MSFRARALTIDLEKTTPQVNHQNKVALENKKHLVGPAVLDARSSFDYAMSHVMGASSLRWQDYSQTEEPHQGCLDPDYDLLARKLRILGVSPERPVVIYGKGREGDGADGRIAWMLAFLGVKNVLIKNFARETTARKTTTALETRQSAPVWLPNLADELRISYREMVEVVAHPAPNDVVIVDVRDGAEFAKAHLPGAINISSKLFYNSDDEIFGPDNVQRVFKEHGVDTRKTLIFVSNQGVRSGLVTFAAMTAHIHARNDEGGMNEWQGSQKNSVKK